MKKFGTKITRKSKIYEKKNLRDNIFSKMFVFKNQFQIIKKVTYVLKVYVFSFKWFVGRYYTVVIINLRIFEVIHNIFCTDVMRKMYFKIKTIIFPLNVDSVK